MPENKKHIQHEINISDNYKLFDMHLLQRQHYPKKKHHHIPKLRNFNFREKKERNNIYQWKNQEKEENQKHHIDELQNLFKQEI